PENVHQPPAQCTPVPAPIFKQTRDGPLFYSSPSERRRCNARGGVRGSMQTRAQKLRELGELRRVEVGHRPELHSRCLPMHDVVSLLGKFSRGCLSTGFGGPNEDVDDVLPVAIHQRSHRAAVEKIQSTSGQREALCAQIYYRW